MRLFKDYNAITNLVTVRCGTEKVDGIDKDHRKYSFEGNIDWFFHFGRLSSRLHEHLADQT